MEPPLGSKEAHELVALEVRTKTGKWVSIHDEAPLVAVNDVAEGWGFGTNNLFDFAGGDLSKAQELLFAYGSLVAALEKFSTLKRPYRVILIAGPFPPAEQG